MKKLLIIILPLIIFLTGCDKKFDNPVDQTVNSFQVKTITTYDSVRYNADDSSVVFRATLSTPIMDLVEVEIFHPDGSKYHNSNVRLFDDGDINKGDLVKGDAIFSNKLLFASNFPSGKYQVSYYATPSLAKSKKIGETSFFFDNGKSNRAPVISDLIAPDSLTVSDTTVFRLSVKAIDPDVQSDIASVYFITTKPDGTSNNNKFLMYDDGPNGGHEDLVKGDLVYSLGVMVTSTNQKGNYRFDFAAKDFGGLSSNKISKVILIK